jgi:hypothetical protein
VLVPKEDSPGQCPAFERPGLASRGGVRNPFSASVEACGDQAIKTPLRIEPASTSRLTNGRLRPWLRVGA